MMADPEAYAAPTPKVFYIHDDLSEYVRRRQGEASLAWRLTQELFALVRRDQRRLRAGICRACSGSHLDRLA